MIFFKSCPKCRGDMSLNRDMYGVYCQCLQCGRLVEVTQEEPEPKTEQAAYAAPARRRLAA